MFGKEPAAILGALSEVIRAVIPTLIIFGIIHWTGDQVAQMMLLVSVVIGFFNILLTRNQTVAMQTANAQIETALKLPSTATVNEVVQKTEAQK